MFDKSSLLTGLTGCLIAGSVVAQQVPKTSKAPVSVPGITVSASNSYTSTAQIRSLKTTPGYLNLSRTGRDFMFRYDPDDNTTPDNGGTVLVTEAKKRYKLALDGPINAQQHFGAKGDGKSDDTKALQAAIDAACKANNPAKYRTASPSSGANTVYIPHGYYRVTDEILVRGSCTIMMEQATSYGGTRIQQATPGKHLFHLVQDNDATSSGVHFIGGILRGGVSKTQAGVALIYGGESKGDANNNSTYIDDVWFQSPEQYGVNILRGGDILIRNCTFDVAALHAVKLGSNANVVGNSSITGCTFFDIRAGAIDLINIDGLLISGNRVYPEPPSRTPYFISAVGPSIKGLQISDNQLDYVNKLAVVTQHGEDILITNNVHRHALGRSIELSGGQTLSTLTITNNIISGDFSGQVNVGTSVPDAPVFGYGSGLTNSRITGNSFRHSGNRKAAVSILLPDNRVTNNIITDNLITGFSDDDQIANPLSNHAVLETDGQSIGPVAGVAAKQRVIFTQPVSGVKPGDQITLVDKAGNWTSPAGVKWDAVAGAPGVVYITLENVTSNPVNVPTVTFRLLISRR